jgi:hypothetical protein
MAKKSTSKKPKTVLELGVTLETCKVIGFYILPPEGNPQKIQITITTRFEVNINVEQEYVMASVLTVGFLGGEDEGKEEERVISIHTISKFIVHNLSKLKVDDKGLVKLPGWVMATIATVAVGMTRGLFYDRVHGTPYEDHTLPILSLHALLPASLHEEIPNHGV